MNIDEILKKLEEVKVEAFNNYHSADSKSVIQLPSETEVELEEDVRGEDTKKKPILGEKEKVPESLSRTTPMAGPTKFNTPKEVYTSGEKKSITTESIQAQLDDLKKAESVTLTGKAQLMHPPIPEELVDNLLQTVQSFQRANGPKSLPRYRAGAWNRLIASLQNIKKWQDETAQKRNQ
tara:strand:- start:158 stop:694 length:537 start_codon:yes stop_codon:yes gene_type:complete